MSGLEGILLGQYLPVDSPVHRLDPRTKILSMLFIMLAVFMSGFAGLAVAALPVAAGIILAKLSPYLLWQQIRPMRLIVLATILLQALLTPGEAILAAGPVSITVQGLLAGLDLLIRIILIIMAGITLTATTSLLSLTEGLESLLKPLGRLGLPVHEMVMAITISVRFVPVILEEARTIMSAQISRGAGFYGPGPAKRAKAVVSLMVPLLVGAFRRSDELATAMEARCYRGGAGRTPLNELAFSTGDVVCILFCGIVPVSALLLRMSAD